MKSRLMVEFTTNTRKERIGNIVILIFVVLVITLPLCYYFFKNKTTYDHSQFEKQIDALNLKQDSSSNNTARHFDENNYQNYYQPSEKNYSSKQAKGELFYFDPNTLSAEGWQRLGIKEKTANTIQNYTSKGGHFNKPEDISKIWGLHEDQVARLLPYVRIEPKPASTFSYTKNTEPYKPYEKIKPVILNIDINKGDTSAFIALPGIGSKLANRIIAFRDKLGGFYKVEQVAETFALPDSTFQKIKDKLVVTPNDVKKININSAAVDELKMHPYLRYNIANAIVQYRTQHGNFSSVSDLKKIMIITDDIYGKAAPYLTTQ
jgi:DNA uptake protein ComE-like DNA-binding protein